MNQKLSHELLKRSKIDQKMRRKYTKTRNMSDWDNSIDEENTKWLKGAIKAHGWPTISFVGKEASNAAWLLVQHSDNQSDFQVKCLKLMKALPKDEIDQANIAYLEDRVRVAQGKPQLYGTQFNRVGDHFEPQTIEDESELDQRRASMGLESFEIYKQRVTK